jgi:hypothetical protein
MRMWMGILDHSILISLGIPLSLSLWALASGWGDLISYLLLQVHIGLKRIQNMHTVEILKPWGQNVKTRTAHSRAPDYDEPENLEMLTPKLGKAWMRSNARRGECLLLFVGDSGGLPRSPVTGPTGIEVGRESKLWHNFLFMSRYCNLDRLRLRHL